MPAFLKASLTILLLSVSVLSGCTQTEVAPTTPEAGTDILVISEGTVGNMGAIRIGLSRTWKKDYVDSQGNSQRGLIATLVMLFEPDRSETKMTVHVGQSFEYHGYTFYVEEIQSTFVLPWSPPGTSG
ncbi:MAG: hypothetical protein FJ045_06405, partial [Crenarchaeota archaeon]|nr:hypothetical protein [Thermoproteota archaeon]